MTEYAYRLDFKVRDYECDLEGIVNNAVYMNYLEHTRHEYFHTIGVDFSELAKNGVNLIVIRAEMDYKSSLRSGDSFWVGLRTERESRLKFVFVQDIYRAGDDRPVMKARITGTAVNEKGRPFIPDEVERAFGLK